jgi:hypothetical protein
MAVKSSLLKNFTLEYVLGIVGILILVYALYKYSENKNILQSGMQNEMPSKPANMNTQEQKNTQNAALDNSLTQNVSDSSELLPKDKEGWGEMAPMNEVSDGLQGMSFVGTRGENQVMRNANLQIRSEPANPVGGTGPWMHSTIEADKFRRPLEIGTSSFQ